MDIHIHIHNDAPAIEGTFTPLAGLSSVQGGILGASLRNPDTISKQEHDKIVHELKTLVLDARDASHTTITEGKAKIIQEFVENLGDALAAYELPPISELESGLRQLHLRLQSRVPKSEDESPSGVFIEEGLDVLQRPIQAAFHRHWLGFMDKFLNPERVDTQD